MIGEMTDVEEVRSRLFETIRTAPLEKIVAFWIKRGKEVVENQGGYGCVSIVEGTPVEEDDSPLDGEDDEMEVPDCDQEYVEECKKEQILLRDGALTDAEKQEITSTLDKIMETKGDEDFDIGFFVTKLRGFMTMAAPEKMKDQIREVINEIC